MRGEYSKTITNENQNKMNLLAKVIGGACGVLLSSTAVWAQQANDLMLAYGIGMLDVPYVANTLDQNETEELVVNCDEVDCTTFVEYALAMVLSPTESGEILESDFIDNVQRIRYRDGKIDGYTSRLHYMTDWIDNGIRNGFLEDVTAAKSPYVQTVTVNYMTTHPAQYKQLANSKENVEKMKQIEAELSKEEIHYVPEEELPMGGLPWIKSGDIIAITTNTPGLDIAHMGIAFYVKGTLSLLHASTVSKKVVVSKLALAQLLKDSNSWTGIRVIRARKP